MPVQTVILLVVHAVLNLKGCKIEENHVIGVFRIKKNLHQGSGFLIEPNNTQANSPGQKH